MAAAPPQTPKSPSRSFPSAANCLFTTETHDQDTQKVLLPCFKGLGLLPQVSLGSLFYAFLPPCRKSLTYSAWKHKRRLLTINCASQEQIKKKTNRFVPGTRRDLEQTREHGPIAETFSNPILSKTKPNPSQQFCKLNVFLQTKSPSWPRRQAGAPARASSHRNTSTPPLKLGAFSDASVQQTGGSL